jgi:hypothetical protein
MAARSTSRGFTVTTDTTGIKAQAAPHAAVALLAVAAAATHSAAEVSGEQATVAMIVAGAAVVLAIAVATKLGQRIACRKSKARLRAFLVIAGTWLTTVTVTGVGMGAVAILAAMVYAVSLHWWRVRRIANPVPGAAAPAVVDVDRYAELWAENLGAKGKALEGSRLTQPKVIDSGIRYVLALVPGKHTQEGVTSIIRQVRNGLLLLPEQDLLIEQHPALDESFLRLTIVTRSPIAGKVDWPGPDAFDAATGCIALGPYADGIGTATWRVYSDNSMWGGYLTGSSGSGKSRMFECLALALAASISHPTVVMFVDGDEGASSPMLARHADHTALDERLEQARAMLAGALLLMQVRRAENIAYGWEGFAPTEERPGVMIFIDECHLIFADEKCQAMAAEISRRGRKVGVNIIAASQVATMDAFGGAGNGADVLRSSLRAGNAVILRSTSNNTKTVFGVDLDPTKFPELPGYGYYVAAKGAGRTAPFRGYCLDDDARAYWPARITWRSLNEGEGNAWGHGYAQRREAAAAAREDALARIAAAKAGHGVARPQARPAATDGLPVPTFPIWTPPAPAAAPSLTDSQQAVLDAIRDGITSAQAISEAVGLSRSQVYNLLGDLQTNGLISKPSGGKYTAKAA